ncbi:MAG: hypothetical protein M5R36_24140 [Deltaproteobacteria bacterium]|nr:hypothetical protein [Deltaproteobacteria bacterium]
MANPRGTRSELLIIGAGTLGLLVAREWLARHPGSMVTGETRTGRNHPDLEDFGVIPRLRDDTLPFSHANVLFCVPPSGAPNYAAEAARAAALWSGKGAFLFTSSSAVYDTPDGGVITETSPTRRNERTEKLLAAEHTVLDAGGSVVRLAGLYNEDRGPHRVYMRSRTLPTRPDGLVNLIHYEDAAGLCVRALEEAQSGTVYLGCDGRPVTREELTEAIARSPRFAGRPLCIFTAQHGPVGRSCSNEATRRALQWQPHYPDVIGWVTRLPEEPHADGASPSEDRIRY